MKQKGKEKRFLLVNQKLIYFLVFLSTFLAYVFSSVQTPFDSRWSLHTSMSIIKEGNTDLNEYDTILSRYGYYAIENVSGRSYTIFPIGVSVLSVPFVFFFDITHPIFFQGSFDSYLHENIPGIYEKIIASFFVSICVVVIYMISRIYLKNRASLLLSFIFAFRTSAWSTASGALWQHGPSMLMLAIALYLLLKAKEKPYLAQYASIPLALSYIIRPTNSISIMLFSLYVLIEYRRYFVKYLLWSLVFSIPFIIYNLMVYSSFLPAYYLPMRLGVSTSQFFQALFGNLISPARGLFVFTPVIAFSIIGIIILKKYKRISKIDYFLIAILLIHLLTLAQFPHWWAGHSYGPRFFTDMLPYFIYFMIPFVWYLSNTKSFLRNVLLSIFVITICISFFIHFRGANHWDVYIWNAEPINVDQDPSRLWMWNDLQFLRGLHFTSMQSSATPLENPNETQE